jgi:hypothetical protein
MVSFVDKSGGVVLDSVIPRRGDKRGRGWAYMPFYPHTVRSRGRSCEDCHGDSLAVGKGYGEDWGSDLPLTRADKPVYPALRLLKEPEMKRLMEKTPRFRDVRSRVLWQGMEVKREDRKKN